MIAPVWLAYFGALSGTVGVLVWAGQVGIFGFDGEPKTPFAHWILSAAEDLTDVNKETTYLVGLLAMVAGPQVLAYLVAGASGVAQRPRFVIFAYRWISLFIAKGFFTASAVSLGILLVGSWYGWLSPGILHVLGYALGSLGLLLVGTLVFATMPVKRPDGRPVSRLVRSVHKLMRRNLRKGNGEVARQLELQAREGKSRRRGLFRR